MKPELSEHCAEIQVGETKRIQIPKDWSIHDLTVLRQCMEAGGFSGTHSNHDKTLIAFRPGGPRAVAAGEN